MMTVGALLSMSRVQSVQSSTMNAGQAFCAQIDSCSRAALNLASRRRTCALSYAEAHSFASTAAASLPPAKTEARDATRRRCLDEPQPTRGIFDFPFHEKEGSQA